MLRSALAPLRRMAPLAGRRLATGSLNEPSPPMHRPSRPDKSSRENNVRLIGEHGDVHNMDIKNSTVTLHAGFCRHRTTLPFVGEYPCVSPEGFVAPNATVVGDVELGDKVLVWNGAVIRGDEAPVEIGAMTNVMENVVISADCDRTDLSLDTDGTGGRVEGMAGSVKVGTWCTIGANSVLRACTLEHSVVIGEGSVVCEGSLIEAGAVVGPGSVVPPGRRVPGGQLWEGNPVAFVKDLVDPLTANDETAKQMHHRALQYLYSQYPLHEPDYSMLHKKAEDATQQNM
uniref:Uncharacterized protein n=1 Tax=Hemiselmis andersenii TaxID=464988 RepID=A0A7S1GZH4_HEMAN